MFSHLTLHFGSGLRCLAVALLALAASKAVCQTPSDVLSDRQWKIVDDSVGRGLAWLAQKQRRDGSFPSAQSGQPAVTSLVTMAFLSRGHRPGVGPYGDTINRAIDYVAAQQDEQGLICTAPTNSRSITWYEATHTATYNHAISGLMLGEAYGMTDQKRTEHLYEVITKGLEYARQLQRKPSPYPRDKYAWRYLRDHGMPNKGNSDLSVTGWFVMYYRSARNAEFHVPEEYVSDAIMFVRECYVERSGGFLYGPYPNDANAGTGRGMTGAGMLCLLMTGSMDDSTAKAASQYILDRPFTAYNRASGGHDRYHYGAYYCSQAMFLQGGETWRKFYPSLAGTLVANQTGVGSWPREGAHQDAMFGECYTTALAILSLTPPYQMLPIYQR